MAVRRLAADQPTTFAFSADNRAWAGREIAKYPEGRAASAVIALLWRVQEQEGWVSEPAIRVVAEMLDMPRIRVLEVATFYTMFQLQPVGKKAHIQVCGTTPCMLRGANDLKDVCRRKIAENQFELSEDGNFSWEEMECLGACVNAPMLQIFKDTYEDLTPEKLEQLIDDIAAGKPVTPGPQNGRHFSVPEGGLTTLVDFDGGPDGGVPVPQVVNGATQTIDSVAGFALNGGEGASATAKPAAKKPAPKKAAAKPAASKPAAKAAAEPTNAASDGPAKKPKMLKKARASGADDLKRIKGIGKVLEDKLHGLGVFHFDQIAAWTDEEVNWVNDHLSFKGRIQREDWIVQAKKLVDES